MSQAKHINLVSEQDYLDGEAVSEIRHEYVNGELFAMTGGTFNHNRITQNITNRFANHLDKGNCEVFSCDVRLKTSAGSYRYPDCMVVCDVTDDNDLCADSPRLIVEVISRSTRKKDEQEKLLEYINIPSLQEYVLIEQDFVKVSVYRSSNHWRPSHYLLDDEIRFESIELSLPVTDIYRRVVNQDMQEWQAQQAKQAGGQ